MSSKPQEVGDLCDWPFDITFYRRWRWRESSFPYILLCPIEKVAPHIPPMPEGRLSLSPSDLQDNSDLLIYQPEKHAGGGEFAGTSYIQVAG